MCWQPGQDRLILLGDLVNGGEDCLAVLRWAAETPGLCTLLGNHDFHLLAVAGGYRSLRSKDTFRPILEATDADDLIAWLTGGSLLLQLEEWEDLFVHAGIPPFWTIEEAFTHAALVESILLGDHPSLTMKALFGDEPRRWNNQLSAPDKARFTVNALTRMRALADPLTLDFAYKGSGPDLPAPLTAWFATGEPVWGETQVIHGHWAALGLYESDRSLNLDSGCVWGGFLTALRLDDRQLFQVPGKR